MKWTQLKIFQSSNANDEVEYVAENYSSKFNHNKL